MLDSVIWQTSLYLQKIQNTNRQHQNATKKFYHKTIADRVRTVSWNNV